MLVMLAQTVGPMSYLRDLSVASDTVYEVETCRNVERQVGKAAVFTQD